MARWRISEREHERRIERVREELERRGLDALYLTSGVSFYYLTGYAYIETERPAALIIPLEGEVAFLGPLLEVDHIPLQTRLIKVVRTYRDYPGEEHPIDCFVKFLKELGLADKTIGIDNPAGAAGRYGYQGPPITERLHTAKFVPARDIVENMRMVKSREEIELLRESAKWANLGVSLLQDYITPGLWDVDIAMQASHEASIIMKKTLGPDYRPTFWRSFPVHAGFRGQVGPMSAIPHSISTGRPIRVGDVVIAEAGADVGGYSSELERTMIVGEPNEKQRRYFEVMRKAQEAAMNSLKPGARCCDADKAASKVIREAGYSHLVRHHTGHGIGLQGHEPPWLDLGDTTVLKPGMVVSCEPGIYEPGFGGFRHSDTILITEDGAEPLTYYPRDIESLTIRL